MKIYQIPVIINCIEQATGSRERIRQIQSSRGSGIIVNTINIYYQILIVIIYNYITVIITFSYSQYLGKSKEKLKVNN